MATNGAGWHGGSPRTMAGLSVSTAETSLRAHRNPASVCSKGPEPVKSGHRLIRIHRPLAPGLLRTVHICVGWSINTGVGVLYHTRPSKRRQVDI